MREIGFSTGAVARGNFRLALELLGNHRVRVVELSALRPEELEPLIAALPTLDLRNFSFVSIHAPSRFAQEDEPAILRSLLPLAQQGFPIVVHPDVIYRPENWQALGANLLVENMDKRKPVGRNVHELLPLFDALPEARFCFDIGHARQVDPSMTEAAALLDAFGHRLAEVHMSEVNTGSRHCPISPYAVLAFSAVAHHIPEHIPIVLESLIDEGQSSIRNELHRAQEVFAELSVGAD